jgi:hypothetical protein
MLRPSERRRGALERGGVLAAHLGLDAAPPVPVVVHAHIDVAELR